MFYLFLAFLFEINTLASDYEPLQDQSWLTCTSSNFVAYYDQASFSVKYQICSKDLDVPSEQEIVSTTQKVFDFASSLGLAHTECAPLEKLEIYKISTEMLNDRKRFSKWSNQSLGKIWGLYDPRLDETGIASIMLTEHGDWDKVTLAHELSHYWYDRLCWNKNWSKSDEQFALDFEKYFSK